MPTFRRSKKNRLAEPAGSVLYPIVRQLGIEEGVRLARMRTAWGAIFKEPLALHMMPVKFSDGELLLQVDSPVWMQQLTFLKQDIIRKLGGYGVRDLRFRLGKTGRMKKDSAGKRTCPELSEEDQEFIRALVTNIADDEIRTAVRRAAERSLKAGKRR